jgi:membrane protease YdiL (CAAX protease family)
LHSNFIQQESIIGIYLSNFSFTKAITLQAFILGLIADYYHEKTGSLIPAYFVHLTFNVVGMVIPHIIMMVMKG